MARVAKAKLPFCTHDAASFCRNTMEWAMTTTWICMHFDWIASYFLYDRIFFRQFMRHKQFLWSNHMVSFDVTSHPIPSDCIASQCLQALLFMKQHNEIFAFIFAMVSYYWITARKNWWIHTFNSVKFGDEQNECVWPELDQNHCKIESMFHFISWKMFRMHSKI